MYPNKLFVRLPVQILQLLAWATELAASLVYLHPMFNRYVKSRGGIVFMPLALHMSKTMILCSEKWGDTGSEVLSIASLVQLSFAWGPC